MRRSVWRLCTTPRMFAYCRLTTMGRLRLQRCPRTPLHLSSMAAGAGLLLFHILVAHGESLNTNSIATGARKTAQDVDTPGSLVEATAIFVQSTRPINSSIPSLCSARTARVTRIVTLGSACKGLAGPCVGRRSATMAIVSRVSASLFPLLPGGLASASMKPGSRTIEQSPLEGSGKNAWKPACSMGVLVSSGTVTYARSFSLRVPSRF
mmetsp:Transcript_30601/g.79376  ORF Transcript_30601/g.79376 Transcript_30601/m.79376 type:complete len:209 (+) Transcript_30601:1921-2547(+)